MPGGLQIAFSLLGIVAIIAAAYFVTYFIATRSTGRPRKGRSIRLHDHFSLSKDKSVCIIEAAGKVYLLAMSSGAITLLDTIDTADYVAAGEAQAGKPVNIETLRGEPGGGNRPGAVFSRIMDAARGGPAARKEPWNRKEHPVQFAREEDELDEFYRKLKQRKMGADDISDGGKGDPD